MKTLKETQERLKELAQHITEPVSPDLCDAIKRRIPEQIQHRWGRDTVNIIVHLRISKITAVAAIILTIVLCLQFFGRSGYDETPLLTELKTLVKYLPGSSGSQASLMDGFKIYHEKLQKDGYNAVYLGDVVSFENPQDIILYWQQTDGRYRVVYVNLRTEVVDTERLIELQTNMLKVRAKK